MYRQCLPVIAMLRNPRGPPRLSLSSNELPCIDFAEYDPDGLILQYLHMW